MLVRVRGGKDGIAEYLRDGMKSDREMHRDQLDKRICIDGDLSITDTIIKTMAKTDKPENYFHVTLSFAERDISEEKIREVYEEYKRSIMSSYTEEEFNIYAEIHVPKIKSYEDKSTGEVVERFPHVHVVIPKKNLLDDKNLNPYGFYKTNLEYFDAIQERINSKFDLVSPFDNQRVFKIDQSKLLARYKGDNFKGANAKLKSELFDSIQDKNITTMSAFKEELAKHGEVSIGKAGKPDEYLKIKPHGSTRNVRLTDSCFRPEFIEHRTLKREKPSEKQVNRLVNEWVNSKSHEVKYIHQAAPKLREQYKALPTQLKGEFLNEQRERYYRQYNLSTGARLSERSTRTGLSERGAGASQRNISTSRRARDRKLGLERGIPRGFTDIPHGLPSVSELNVATGGRKRGSRPTELLHDNASDHLAIKQTSRSLQLRRSGYEPRRRVVRLSVYRKPSPNATLATIRRIKAKAQHSESYVTQLFDTFQENKQEQSELGRFRTIRQNLKAENLLSHLSDSHGLVKDQYSHFKAKDGSVRIKAETRAYNVSDFCTKYMGLSWDETKEILKTTYGKQRQQLAQQQRVRQEQQAVNSIVFVSNRVTQGWGKKNPLDESIRLLKHLQRKEHIGELPMALHELERHRAPETKDNAIVSANESFSAVESAKRIMKARETAAQITLTMNDLVASKNDTKRYVDFSDKNTGDKVFRDDGEKIVMHSKQADINHTAAALTLAAEKFGVVKINGTKEFKDQVIDVAVSKDLNIVFADKKMEADFVRCKEELKRDVIVETMDSARSKSEVATELKEHMPHEAANAQLKEEVLKPARFEVEYQWDKLSGKLQVTINGKSPNRFEQSTVEQIVKKDTFLKHYTVKEVQFGLIDQKKAEGVQPVPKTYDAQANVIDKISEQKQSHRMK
ncbi:LPD7 domain-containing protein [Vibrio campbellii]|uniref:Relaxase n=1 Tax=Vibrio campbellii TaxID=680 RepID=A0AAQ3B1U7_9VIBR|nr:LPD7 domain-containing protein [Vibrio campbellii]EDL68383.1 putative relaxase [Vibrio campbellii HY01]EHE7894253.1 relaxase [Vibrio parahaemolyticus]EJE4227731.1 relaxase [Vibrio parahaemolyticus]EKI0734754.1 relaxase [Vibrio parahaemolyticus]MBE4144356.1 relaxase [Vibrio parahaemolyticus]